MTGPITINGKTWLYDETSRTHRPAETVAAETVAAATGDRAAVPTADVEHDNRNGPMDAKANPRFDSPVRIRIVSHRLRLVDADAVSAKACIDGLVHCGIIKDDSAAFVAEVSYRQVKVKTAADEQTLIEIEAV